MTNIDGHKIKIAVAKSGKTPEKIVSLVQDVVIDNGLSFSLAGLSKIFNGDLPRKEPEVILDALALVLGHSVSDFKEAEKETA